MRRTPLLAAVVACAAALVQAGCRLPSSPPTRYWVLQPLAGDPADGEVALRVGVGPFELPGYLERREIVSRWDGSRLHVAAFDNWGEALDRGFAQTLARNLEVLVPGSAATVFPWKGAQPIDRQVAGVLTRFEVVDGETAQLELTWAVTRLPDARRIGGGSWRGQAPLEGDGTAAGVDALSRVLAEFSREVARVIAEGGPDAVGNGHAQGDPWSRRPDSNRRPARCESVRGVHGGVVPRCQARVSGVVLGATPRH